MLLTCDKRKHISYCAFRPLGLCGFGLFICLSCSVSRSVQFLQEWLRESHWFLLQNSHLVSPERKARVLSETPQTRKDLEPRGPKTMIKNTIPESQSQKGHDPSWPSGTKSKTHTFSQQVGSASNYWTIPLPCPILDDPHLRHLHPPGLPHSQSQCPFEPYQSTWTRVQRSNFGRNSGLQLSVLCYGKIIFLSFKVTLDVSMNHCTPVDCCVRSHCFWLPFSSSFTHLADSWHGVNADSMR